MDSIFVIQLRLWLYVPSIIGLEMIVTNVSLKTFNIFSPYNICCFLTNKLVVGIPIANPTSFAKI
jgi:hypothetical protein